MDKVHLHIENSRALGEVFEVTEERLREALLRHSDVAAEIDVSIGYDGESLEREIGRAQALFAWDFSRHSLAERAPNLRWIHVHGAGISHLTPLDWLPQRTVLTNSRGVHGQRATEYALMAILMLHNRLPEMVTNQRERAGNSSSIPSWMARLC